MNRYLYLEQCSRGPVIGKARFISSQTETKCRVARDVAYTLLLITIWKARNPLKIEVGFGYAFTSNSGTAYFKFK